MYQNQFIFWFKGFKKSMYDFIICLIKPNPPRTPSQRKDQGWKMHSGFKFHEHALYPMATYPLQSCNMFRQRREWAQRKRSGGSHTANLHCSLVSSELSPQSLSPSHINLRGMHTVFAHSNSNCEHWRRFGWSPHARSSDAFAQSLRLNDIWDLILKLTETDISITFPAAVFLNFFTTKWNVLNSLIKTT